MAFSSTPSLSDVVETFSIVELIYPASGRELDHAKAALVIDGQQFPGFVGGDGTWHFLFSPKEAKTWTYRISSDVRELDGQTGGSERQKINNTDSEQFISKITNLQW